MAVISQTDGIDAHIPLHGRSVSFPIVDVDNTNSEATEQTVNTLSDGSDNSSEAAVEIIMQPHEVQPAGGGGESNDRGWRDDDKEKEKNNRPYKRRR